MKYVKGDIVSLAKTGQYDVIVHGCNCFHTMGAGVAKAIREEWPEAYEADVSFGPRGSWVKMGRYSHAKVELSPGHPLYIINAYVQYSTGQGKQVEYCAVDSVFESLVYHFRHNKILIPQIGAGLGGGDWKIIEEIIDQYNLDVTCCVL